MSFVPHMPRDSVVGKYLVLDYIEHGMSGEVYYVRDTTDCKIYAMKLELKETVPSTLGNEIELIKKLNNSRFPRFHDSGETEKYTYLVEEALGISLYSFMKPGKKLSMKSAVLISKESLKCLKELHMNGIVHNDFKPSNICFRPMSNTQMALIDLGFSYHYKDTESNDLLPKEKFNKAYGTAKYCSVNAHKGYRCFPVDDLFSWFYVTLELLGKKLPWKRTSDPAKVFKIKSRTRGKDLCLGLSRHMIEIYDLISTYDHFSDIDYEAILALLDKVCFFRINRRQ